MKWSLLFCLFATAALFALVKYASANDPPPTGFCCVTTNCKKPCASTQTSSGTTVWLQIAPTNVIKTCQFSYDPRDEGTDCQWPLDDPSQWVICGSELDFDNEPDCKDNVHGWTPTPHKEPPCIQGSNDCAVEDNKV